MVTASKSSRFLPKHIGPRKAQWRRQYAAMRRKVRRLPVDSPEFRRLCVYGHELALRAGGDCYEDWKTVFPRLLAQAELQAAARIEKAYSTAGSERYLSISIEIDPFSDNCRKRATVHLHPDNVCFAPVAGAADVARVVADHLRREAAAMLEAAERIEREARIPVAKPRRVKKG